MLQRDRTHSAANADAQPRFATGGQQIRALNGCGIARTRRAPRAPRGMFRSVLPRVNVTDLR